MKTVVIWLLSGALATSLALYTARVLEARVPAAPAACSVTSCALGGGAVAGDMAGLCLSEEDLGKLREACNAPCSEGADLARREREKSEELERALADASRSGEEIRALAAELGALRAQTLANCVDSIVRVRSVLSQKQLEALVECCPPK
jgi:hypothetical protein